MWEHFVKGKCLTLVKQLSLFTIFKLFALHDSGSVLVKSLLFVFPYKFQFEVKAA